MSVAQPPSKPAEEAPPPAEPSEEMDLVEQLYGDISLRDAPIPEPTKEEEEIYNRVVDEQAWARQSALEHDSTPSPSSSTGPAIPHSNGTPSSKPSLPSTTPTRPTARTASTRPATSLDDYAGRMRMAAIMLAQLDASQATSKGVVATGTAAAGTLVGLPVATVAGLGGAVGAGLGAVASRFTRRDSMAPPQPTASSNSQAGQASMGMIAALDTASAAEGASAVAGAPSLAAPQPSAPGSAPPPPAHRPRVLAATDAAAIRTRIMNEMMALEEERMARMRDDGRARSGWTPSSGMEDGAVVLRAVSKDDPSGAFDLTRRRSTTDLAHSQAPFCPSRSLARRLASARLLLTAICPAGTLSRLSSRRAPTCGKSSLRSSSSKSLVGSGVRRSAHHGCASECAASSASLTRD